MGSLTTLQRDSDRSLMDQDCWIMHISYFLVQPKSQDKITHNSDDDGKNNQLLTYWIWDLCHRREPMPGTINWTETHPVGDHRPCGRTCRCCYAKWTGCQTTPDQWCFQSGSEKPLSAETQPISTENKWLGGLSSNWFICFNHPSPKGQHRGRGGRKNVSRKHGEECHRMLPSGCAVDMTVRNSPGICGVLYKSNTTEPSAFQQEALMGLDGFP